jgi:hypothetical protein
MFATNDSPTQKSYASVAKRVFNSVETQTIFTWIENTEKPTRLTGKPKEKNVKTSHKTSWTWTGSLINLPCPRGGPLESWLFEALLFTLFFVVEEIEVLTEVVAVWEELDVLEEDHEGFDCKNNSKCSNCGQPHMASSKYCQHFIREKEIQKIKSDHFFSL